MKRTARPLTSAIAIAAVSVVLLGCVGPIAATRAMPRLSPPVIARPGVLRVVVDLGYPPFAGTVEGRPVGLDIDVASAIADRLGLRLDVVDARSADATDLGSPGVRTSSSAACRYSRR